MLRNRLRARIGIQIESEQTPGIRASHSTAVHLHLRSCDRLTASISESQRVSVALLNQGNRSVNFSSCACILHQAGAGRHCSKVFPPGYISKFGCFCFLIFHIPVHTELSCVILLHPAKIRKSRCFQAWDDDNVVLSKHFPASVL